MNPFDLRGPEFLAFYLAYIVVVFVVVKLIWRLATSRNEPALPRHPYDIAFLRGGAREAAKVAVVSLLRSRVVFKPDDVHYFADKYGAGSLTEPLDRSIVQHFQTYVKPDQSILTELAQTVAPHYKKRLAALGLWADGWRNAARLVTMAGILAALWIVAGMKISIALDRGHTNIGFLIALASIASFGTLIWLMPEGRTTAGDKALTTLRELNKNANGTGDFILYAAIFGAAAVALEGNPFYREAASGGDSGSGGSDSGGAGDSGCGGGSGCGGCGGGGGGD